MPKRITFPLVVVTCFIANAFFSKLSARDDTPSNWINLEKSYAQANFELAQARLAVAQSQNKAVAGTISKQTMEDLQSGVQVAGDQLKQIVVNNNANAMSPRITAERGNVQALETNYAESLKANQLQAGTVPDV